jgi:N-acyl-L-homoserine lactone synthetase
MQVLLTISRRKQGHNQMIQFGVPETQQEVQHMHQLRYQVLVEKKQYISEAVCLEGREMDHYDHNDGCHYFIAQCDEQLVGAIRLIQQYPLPLRSYWRFEEPIDMRGLRHYQTVEISRLVSHRPSAIIIPPSLVPLGLIRCATHFCLAHGIRAAYAALQVKLVRQIERWGLPVQRIDSYEPIYDESDDNPYKHYFSNPACPTYFRPQEVNHFYEDLLQQALVFKQLTAEHYLYQPSSES